MDIDAILRGAVYIIGLLVCYQVAFRVIGFCFKAKKFRPAQRQYKYAVLVAARNEEKVIAQFVDSVKKQDYPGDKVSVFVVADNCTDETAKMARDAGAIVYERVNPPKNQRRKGCALDFLVKNIQRDFGITAFDGYFIFDADNLLASNYISEMNKAFDDKRFDYFNSYINVKNFGTSFISSFSSLTLYNATCNLARPMALLGLTQRKRGTGCLVRSHFLLDGYPWHSLVEDNEFSAYAISRGYRGVVCEAAEFFDEQPQTLRVLMRQRMRWARGKFIVWLRYTPRLLFGLFVPVDFRRKEKEARIRELQSSGGHLPPEPSGLKKQNMATSLLGQVQKRFSVYDMYFSLIPTSILTFVYGFIYPVGAVIYKLAVDSSYALTPVFETLVLYYGGVYLFSFISNLFTIVREHRKIRIRPTAVIRYLFFWPVISIVIEYASLWALLMPRFEWKPIPHYENKEIEQIYEDKTLAERLYNKQVEK